MTAVPRHSNKGFTLVEAAAAVVLLGMLLTGAYAILNNTTQSVAKNLIRERAIEIARRQMELLIVSKQEPESTGLETIDEIDTDFTWQLDLEREPVGNKVANLENTIIHATVTVRFNAGDNSMSPLELHRFFGSLEPKPGNVIAVPLKSAYEFDESYQKLKQMLGREPTPQEMLEYQFRLDE